MHSKTYGVHQRPKLDTNVNLYCHIEHGRLSSKVGDFSFWPLYSARLHFIVRACAEVAISMLLHVLLTNLSEIKLRKVDLGLWVQGKKRISLAMLMTDSCRL